MKQNYFLKRMCQIHIAVFQSLTCYFWPSLRGTDPQITHQTFTMIRRPHEADTVLCYYEFTSKQSFVHSPSSMVPKRVRSFPSPNLCLNYILNLKHLWFPEMSPLFVFQGVIILVPLLKATAFS